MVHMWVTYAYLIILVIPCGDPLICIDLLCFVWALNRGFLLHGGQERLKFLESTVGDNAAPWLSLKLREIRKRKHVLWESQTSTAWRINSPTGVYGLSLTYLGLVGKLELARMSYSLLSLAPKRGSHSEWLQQEHVRLVGHLLRVQDSPTIWWQILEWLWLYLLFKQEAMILQKKWNALNTALMIDLATWIYCTWMHLEEKLLHLNGHLQEHLSVLCAEISTTF